MPAPRFILSAPSIQLCPNVPGREVAVIGRSNVGKSSLLAALLGHESLVRRSRTPGRTQLINFFETGEGLRLVDLPGYGFAKVPKGMKAGLLFMVQEYLAQREQLDLIVLLIDARRGEASPDDLAHFDFAHRQNKQVLVVVTKIDRVPKAQRKPVIRGVEQSLGLVAGSAIAFSAMSGEGKDAIERAIGPK